MLNKIIMQGRLTKKPEIRTANDKNITLFSIACNEGKDQVTYMNCKAFGKTGETIAKHLDKGSEVIVIGALSTYTKDKTTYYSIAVQSFEFCGSKKKESSELDILEY